MPAVPEPAPQRLPDWEAFYRDYRKPGYVGGFEITSKLGGGAFGLVFRARKESIGKDYAIKFLKVEDGEVRQAVLRELEQVQYFAQVDHPNLVQIEDRGEVDGIPYLVMQYAGSDTLRDRMPADGKPATGEQQAELLGYFLQACRGVAALHERSLVHFDLKPANVFLKGPVARVGDYGLSKLVTHSRGSLTMGRGTPYYMAPEMLQRRGDHRSDVYSLGVMLYELLCGKVPFTGDSEWEVLKKHETQTPDFPAHLQPVPRAVLQRCLQKDPDARFQSVHDIVQTLGESRPAVRVTAALPAMLAANGVTPPPLPTCVPPPIPTPPPLPGTRRAAAARPAKPRRSTGRRVFAAALVAAAAVMLIVTQLRTSLSAQAVDARQRAREAAEQAHALTTATTLGGRLTVFLENVKANVRRAAESRRPVKLRALSLRELEPPAGIDDQARLVEQLAAARTFPEAYAAKVAREGRGVFLAGVATLQELDYADADDCRKAANVTALLAQMTAMPGLVIEASGCEPTRSDSCRYQAYAAAWCRLCTEFAATEHDWRALMVQQGRPTGL